MPKATAAAALLAATIALLPLTASASANEAGIVVASVNAYRHSHGVATVGTDFTLNRLAARQAERMRNAGYIFHNQRLADELQAATPDWSFVAENVGEGPSVEEIDDAFIASPTHEHNIVDPRYNAVGTAVATNAEGRVYVVQIFARFEDMTPERSPEHSPEEQAVFVPVAYFPTACAGAPLYAEDGSRVPPGYYGLFGC